MATGFDLAGFLQGMPYGKDPLVRGKLEIRCPICGKWEKTELALDNLVSEGGSNSQLIAELHAYSNGHDCHPPSITVTFHKDSS